jgi:putative peptidoglycan lipid II flippase
LFSWGLVLSFFVALEIYEKTFMSAEISPSLEKDKEQERTNANLAGATIILALGNIASRVLGLAREKALVYLFGASAASDAFRIAVLVPRTFYDLLIGGHVNGAIVPVLTEIVTIKGREELWKVVNILVTLVLLVVSLLVIVIEIFAPAIVQLMAEGYNSQTQELAIGLLRITSPALIFLALFAVFSGTLYALKSFTWPAFAGVIFNGSIVLITLLITPPAQILFAPENAIIPFSIGRPMNSVTAAAVGWFIGAALQMAFQLPSLRLGNLRISFHWRHPALRSIMLLYLPVMASLLMDTLVIRFFSYRLASETGIEGSISYMDLATTLIQFPQGLVATAISIAILPTLASQAALIAETGLEAFRNTLGLGIRLASNLIIPAAFGLFVLATPIVVLLFQGGAFTAADTNITVFALRLYLIGLPFAAIDLLLVYAFYARKDTLTPALIGMLSHLVYIVMVLLLFDRYNLFSLMIADSVKHIVHALVSAWLLRYRMGGFGKQRFVRNIFKTLLASFAMALVAEFILPILYPAIGTEGFVSHILLVLIAAGICSAVFFILAYLLKIEELRWLLKLLRQRIGR